MTTLVIGVVAAVVLVLLGALVTLAETALSRSSEARAEYLEDDHPVRAERLAGLLTEPETTLNPLRLVGLVFLVAQVVVVTVLAARLDSPWALLGVSVLNVAVLYVAIEVMPRTFAILHTDRVSLAASRPVAALVRSPFVGLVARALIRFSNLVLPGEGLRSGPFASAGEFVAMADAAVADEVIDSDGRDLIESVLEFGNTVVREVMVPRPDMTTIPVDATVAEALAVTSAAGFSRVPAVGEDIDDVLGLVYVKDLIRAELSGSTDLGVAELLRPSRFVPETKKVAPLLREMQTETFHMAVVVDEYGGIAGLVTLEDLIEEIVGEIVDEYDVEDPLVQRLADGSVQVDGRILIDEANDLMGWDLPEGDFDTVAGLILDRLGTLPTVGAVVAEADLVLRVARVQGRRITKVTIRHEPAAAETDSEDVRA